SFNATATPHPSPLSLHDALPISALLHDPRNDHGVLGDRVEDAAMAAEAALVGERAGDVADVELIRIGVEGVDPAAGDGLQVRARSEEHTSELQSLTNLVCRLLLE